MSDAAIRLEDVSVRFPGAPADAVHALSLEVARQELLVLLGESGSGKTTTLKTLNRLVEVSRGRVLVQGEDLARTDIVRLRRSMGYVIQGVGLFPHMSVAENVAVVPRMLGWAEDRVQARTEELLRLVKLSPGDFFHRLPGSLSGGERQRVGLARALAARPGIMLMDEPFGALDPATRDHLQHEYRDLHRTLSLTTVLVTHDMTEALLLADRIAVLRRGELLQVASPRELLSSPAHPDVERLLEIPRRRARELDALFDRRDSREPPSTHPAGESR